MYRLCFCPERPIPPKGCDCTVRDQNHSISSISQRSSCCSYRPATPRNSFTVGFVITNGGKWVSEAIRLEEWLDGRYGVERDESLQLQGARERQMHEL